MIRDKIDLQRAANCEKLLGMVKTELVSCLPTSELSPYFREIDAIRASLMNRIRLEDPNYGTSQAKQGAAGSKAGPGAAPPSEGTGDS